MTDSQHYVIESVGEEAFSVFAQNGPYGPHVTLDPQFRTTSDGPPPNHHCVQVSSKSDQACMHGLNLFELWTDR